MLLGHLNSDCGLLSSCRSPHKFTIHGLWLSDTNNNNRKNQTALSPTLTIGLIWSRRLTGFGNINGTKTLPVYLFQCLHIFQHYVGTEESGSVHC